MSRLPTLRHYGLEEPEKLLRAGDGIDDDVLTADDDQGY